MRQMKDSGIEWIGEIPEGWEVRKVKKIFSIVNGSTPKSDYSDFWDGDIIWVTPAEMSDDIYIIDNSKRKLTTLGYTSCGTTLVPKNSILISSRAPIGQVALAGNKLCTNQGCKALVSNDEISEKFFCYFFKIQSSALNSLGKGTTFLELSSSELGNFIVPYPPLEEQQRIADYLDAKCAHIDQCLELTRQSMEKLRAYKLSCITEAVTKGLDPDVPLKDSGVPWIGQIPVGWTLSSVRWEFENLDGRRKPISAENRTCSDAAYDYYGASGIIDKIDDFIFDETLILIGEDGANLALRNLPLVYIAKGKYWVNNHAHILKPYNTNNLYYMAYQLECVDLTNYITGSTQPKLTQSNLSKIPVVCPPLPEQERIAAYLDKKCARIDALLEEKQALLDKLAEYKKSLIFECVTGKREVPSCWNR
ncbi:restriction endonuclease subunit S [Desulfovibrio piger]|uniref:Type I restriction-modification system, specificity subunit S n=1 Tax=Desulfovibrio piger TaxID=901 RepID=A0A1K1LDN2_9BACT|nr:restriction endonuclease subunit S [Desulfovibrio piger]SFV72807.1 Type I restriction-modification system, specificity subunit S [Desulfovibrio piger]